MLLLLTLFTTVLGFGNLNWYSSKRDTDEDKELDLSKLTKKQLRTEIKDLEDMLNKGYGKLMKKAKRCGVDLDDDDDNDKRRLGGGGWYSSKRETDSDKIDKLKVKGLKKMKMKKLKKTFKELSEEADNLEEAQRYVKKMCKRMKGKGDKKDKKDKQK